MFEVIVALLARASITVSIACQSLWPRTGVRNLFWSSASAREQSEQSQQKLACGDQPGNRCKSHPPNQESGNQARRIYKYSQTHHQSGTPPQQPEKQEYNSPNLCYNCGNVRHVFGRSFAAAKRILDRGSGALLFGPRVFDPWHDAENTSPSADVGFVRLLFFFVFTKTNAPDHGIPLECLAHCDVQGACVNPIPRAAGECECMQE